MSIKKKMSMGILAGALGVSLIGGGTWAAFNDVETTSNNFNAGTLDLVVGNETTFEFTINNLKPGDYFTKSLVLENKGSLDINQIKLHAMKIEATTFEDKDELKLNDRVAGSGNNSEEDFLSQFNVKIENSKGIELYNGALSDLYTAGVEELTETNANTIGLGIKKSETFDFTFEFVEDDETFSDSRLMKQNKYQGEGTDMTFVFEATQMPGTDRSND